MGLIMILGHAWSAVGGGAGYRVPVTPGFGVSAQANIAFHFLGSVN